MEFVASSVLQLPQLAEIALKHPMALADRFPVRAVINALGKQWVVGVSVNR